MEHIFNSCLILPELFSSLRRAKKVLRGAVEAANYEQACSVWSESADSQRLFRNHIIDSSSPVYSDTHRRKVMAKNTSIIQPPLLLSTMPTNYCSMINIHFRGNRLILFVKGKFTCHFPLRQL